MFNPISVDVSIISKIASCAFKQRLKENKGHYHNKTPSGPFIGTWGELIFEEWLKVSGYDELSSGALKSKTFRRISPQPDNDYELKNNKDSFTLDVKTKRRTRCDIKPEEHFELSVPAYLYDDSKYKHPNYYFAIQVCWENGTTDFSSKPCAAWLCGYISSMEFEGKKYYLKKGSPTGGHSGKKRTMPTAVYNVMFKDLSPTIDFLSI